MIIQFVVQADPGDRWIVDIAKTLKSYTYILVCITFFPCVWPPTLLIIRL